MPILFELQKSIYNRLKNDTNLMGMVDKIYNYVPQNSNMSYIILSGIKAEDLSSLASTGIKAEIELQIFTRNKSEKEMIDIITRIRDLLHQYSLSVTNHNFIMMKFTSSNITILTDGVTYFGSANFLALVRE